YWTTALVDDGLPALASNIRVHEDVILNNVIGFDVKVWDREAPVFGQVITDDAGNPLQTEPVLPDDPAYKFKLAGSETPLARGAYVDLFYERGTPFALSDPPRTAFSGPGEEKSGLRAGANTPATWCSWSTHYENDGRNQD